MCGIFGILKPGNNISSNSIEIMSKAMNHRGPDHTGIYTETGVALGNNRLSIIDLYSGNQPIFNEDKSLLIVYNGEIYNHSEIKNDLKKKGHIFRTNSDAETVLHSFEEYKADCLKYLNGMFAFAIWNVHTKKLFIARDRLGIKPLYTTFFNNTIAFASEAKALFHLLPKGVRPDWTAIYRYFSFGYFPPPDSPFLEIKKFPAAHYSWINQLRSENICYWKPDYDTKNKIDISEASINVYNLLEKVIELEFMSDVPVGLLLSGGLDSSAVALFASKYSKVKVNSFTLRFEETTHDESADARLVAKHFGFEHHELLFSKDILLNSLGKVFDILDEPFADSTVLPLLALSEFVKEHVKVVLTGWGGDEIFSGYPTYKAHQLSQYYRKLPHFFSNKVIPSLINRLPVSEKYMSFEFRARRFIKGINLSPEEQHFIWMGYYTDIEKKRLFKNNILDQIQGRTLDPVYKALNSFKEKDIISRTMHLDTLFFLENNGLFQADRMTMAASIEARVPLLNNDLIEYVNSLPVRIKMYGGKTKGLLKNVLENHIPKSILNKPKKGFGPPSSIWTRDVFIDLFNNLFSLKKIEEDGIFNFNEIKRLLFEHRTRKADHGRTLWALLSFQLWYNKFIKGERLEFT